MKKRRYHETSKSWKLRRKQRRERKRQARFWASCERAYQRTLRSLMPQGVRETLAAVMERLVESMAQAAEDPGFSYTPLVVPFNPVRCFRIHN